MQASRREFLETMTAALFYPSTCGLESRLAFPAFWHKRTTLDEALADKEGKKGIRERFLNQVAKEMFGEHAFEHISEIRYDHDGSFRSELFHKWMMDSIKDPRHHAFLRKELDLDQEILEKALENYSRDERFNELPGRQRTLRIIEFLNTPSGVEDYARKRAYDTSRSVIRDSGYAAVFNNLYSFATGKKSPIFFDKGIFDKIEIDLMGKTISRPVTEEFIKACFYHEFIHARDISRGIEIGEGLYLNNDNITSIADSVESFIVEGSAYMSMMDRVRTKSEEGPWKHDTGYVLAAVNLTTLFKETSEDLSRKIVSLETNKLFSSMSRRLRPYLEEANRVIVDTFYETLPGNR